MKSLRNPNRKPTHPGAVLREDVLSDLLHEKRALTAEMAVRVAKVIGGTPEGWLHMQEALDLWKEKHAGYVLRRQ